MPSLEPISDLFTAHNAIVALETRLAALDRDECEPLPDGVSITSHRAVLIAAIEEATAAYNADRDRFGLPPVDEDSED